MSLPRYHVPKHGLNFLPSHPNVGRGLGPLRYQDGSLCALEIPFEMEKLTPAGLF